MYSCLDIYHVLWRIRNEFGRKQSLSPAVAIIKRGSQTFVPVGDTRILEGDMLLTIEDMPRKERGR